MMLIIIVRYRAWAQDCDICKRKVYPWNRKLRNTVCGSNDRDRVSLGLGEHHNETNCEKCQKHTESECFFTRSCYLV